MSTEVILPQMGFSMSEGEVTDWVVADGAQVELGTHLCNLEADKSTVEIEAPAAGTLRILKQPGLYEVGTVLALIE